MLKRFTKPTKGVYNKVKSKTMLYIEEVLTVEETKNVNDEVVTEEVTCEDVELEAGQVQIADDVIAVIAEIATLEVEGTAGVGGKNDIVNTIRGKKAAKGIRVEVGEGEVFIEIMCTVKYGVKIQDVCLKIQQKVKNSIETMTGLHVRTVDVHVMGVEFPKAKTADEY